MCAQPGSLPIFTRSTPPRLMLVLALACLLVAGSATAATMYRWTDAHGQVHFSDHWQAGAQTYHPDAPQPVPASAPAKPPAAAAATTHDDCVTLRARLTSYRKATSITETDPLGKAHVFTPAEQEQLIARTRSRVDEACASADDAATDTSAMPGTR